MNLVYVIALVFLLGFQTGCMVLVLARRWRCVDTYRAVDWRRPRDERR